MPSGLLGWLEHATSMGRHHCTKTGWLPSNAAALVRRTMMLAGMSLLIVSLSSATLPPAWHGVP